MEVVNKFLSSILPYTEWVMLFLIIGGGLFLVFYSKLLPYRYFRHALNITRGKYDNPNDPGEVSHLQALSSAVAATVGMGNIAGVTIAIYGPQSKTPSGLLLYRRPVWRTARFYHQPVYPDPNDSDTTRRSLYGLGRF